jgi:hypothetical protein
MNVEERAKTAIVAIDALLTPSELRYAEGTMDKVMNILAQYFNDEIPEAQQPDGRETAGELKWVDGKCVIGLFVLDTHKKKNDCWWGLKLVVDGAPRYIRTGFKKTQLEAQLACEQALRSIWQSLNIVFGETPSDATIEAMAKEIVKYIADNAMDCEDFRQRPEPEIEWFAAIIRKHLKDKK